MSRAPTLFFLDLFFTYLMYFLYILHVVFLCTYKLLTRGNPNPYPNIPVPQPYQPWGYGVHTLPGWDRWGMGWDLGTPGFTHAIA